MDFDRISAVGLERAKIWHPGGLTDWTVSDWTVATAGEAGEVCNAIKKLKRVEQKISQKHGPQDLRSAQLELGTEVGDTYLYLDLLAQRIGTSPYYCFGLVQLDFQEFFKNDSLPHLGLHLMSIVGAISVLAITADISPDPDTRPQMLDAMRDKIGRSIQILDLIAERAELELEACVVDTFNRVSVREGFPQRL